jgi:hypothetical protein
VNVGRKVMCRKERQARKNKAGERMMAERKTGRKRKYGTEKGYNEGRRKITGSLKGVWNENRKKEECKEQRIT